MKITIERLSNGYLICGGDEQQAVYQHINEEEDICLNALQGAIYDILERLGYHGSKHDRRRLFVNIINQFDENGKEVINEPDSGDNIQGD